MSIIVYNNESKDWNLDMLLKKWIEKTFVTKDLQFEYSHLFINFD